MSEILHDQAARQFRTEVDGHRAVLDYALNGATMSITHTEVAPAIGGRGVAADLMKAALTAARERHWEVHPVCSYAVAYMKKHPEPVGHSPPDAHLDELLDEALDESYPASDSPSVGGSR